MVLRWILLSVVPIGLIGLVGRRNVLSKVLAMDVMNTGVISLFVHASYRAGPRAPLLGDGTGVYADPIPQAAILTAIVIGFATLALLIVYVMDISKSCTTLDVSCIERRSRR